MSMHGTGSSRSHQLILAGIVHTDIASYATLVSILRSVEVTAIALETHLYSIAFRLGPGAGLKGVYRRFLRSRNIPPGCGGELSCRIAHLRIPFEYLAARSVARRSGDIEIVHLGRKRDAVAGLAPLVRESLDSDWLTLLSSTGNDHAVKLRAAVADAAAGRTSTTKPGLRDAVMIRGIKDLIEKEQRVVAILGWEHLSSSNPGNVFDGLSEQNPIRIIVAGGQIAG